MKTTAKGELIQEESVICRAQFSSRQAALRAASDCLAECGHVKEGFYEALIQREEHFPTGICLGDICVAIPHSEPRYVYTPALLVMTLENPVPFINMEDCTREINVRLIFVLAFTDEEKHLNVLQQISELIRDEKAVDRLLESKSSRELYRRLRESPLGLF